MTELKTIENEVSKIEEERKKLNSGMEDARSQLNEKRKARNDARSKVDEVEMRLRKNKAVLSLKDLSKKGCYNSGSRNEDRI